MVSGCGPTVLTTYYNPLSGHESPFAIQTYHNRLQMDLSGDGKPQQLDFILRRKPSSGGVYILGILLE